uniref:VWFA domain-containing protein n=2 Tax=Magallana gigas TaxID=29159 RepID=A0A8W8J7S8_MAGGI|nr:uncharacterized protein LOC109621096 [Crassostrea gigas]
MEKNFLSTAVIFSFLIVRASGFCGVHQTLDVVILYDVSSSMKSTSIAYQVSFIHNLAGNIYLHSDHTNIAGIGVGNTAHYGWGLRDYLTTDDLMARMQNITATSEGSDISPGMDMAWNNIFSNNTRSGSTRWVLVFTDTKVMSSTTSLDAIKAAGIKVGFISTLSATDYTSYASDSRYILGGISWATLDSDLPTVISMICPPYCESFDFYYELPNSMAVIADTNSNVGYYLISESKGPSAYNIHCCGALSSLEFKAATSGSFVLQVWRAEYLIYQTTITATGGYQTHVFSPKVAIAMSDIIGWYSAGVNPIGMATSCVGDLCPQDIKIVTDMGSLSVGDFYDWSSASTMPDTAFAIKFTIVNGTVPTFSGGSSPISISESLTVGSSVTVVSLTDDFGDQFMFSDLGNPYFEINQTTGLISLMTSLPVTGVETPYFLTMSVIDSCFNTASIAINITTFVQPLAINNLPTEVEIGDDVSFETLLIVINATDPAADSISCILSSILPNTTNFRLDDYLNGTAGMFLNAGAALDFKTVEEYKISITCTGMSSTESFMTVRILDKSVTTPYTVPAWAAGAIVVSVGSVGVVLAMVCFLIVVILATTDEAEVMPPMEEDENDKTPLDDVAQMCKIIDRWESEQEGVGEI